MNGALTLILKPSLCHQPEHVLLALLDLGQQLTELRVSTEMMSIEARDAVVQYRLVTGFVRRDFVVEEPKSLAQPNRSRGHRAAQFAYLTDVDVRSAPKLRQVVELSIAVELRMH